MNFTSSDESIVAISASADSVVIRDSDGHLRFRLLCLLHNFMPCFPRLGAQHATNALLCDVFVLSDC